MENIPVRLRFHPDHFAALIDESKEKQISLRAVVHRRMRSLARSWPNVSYVLTAERQKKKLAVDVSTIGPDMYRIAEEIGCVVASLGDVIATHQKRDAT